MVIFSRVFVHRVICDCKLDASTVSCGVWVLCSSGEHCSSVLAAITLVSSDLPWPMAPVIAVCRAFCAALGLSCVCDSEVSPRLSPFLHSLLSGTLHSWTSLPLPDFLLPGRQSCVSFSHLCCCVAAKEPARGRAQGDLRHVGHGV